MEITRSFFNNNLIISLIFVIALIASSSGFAADHTVNLTVAYKKVNFAGKVVRAIAVNDQIPAPTLHFKEGDHVTINVYNHLDKGTAIHWHGILVPWQMDGVEGISQKAIPPGGVFHYQFTLEQSGTYWYHAHAGLQEQQGLYGAFIIDPPAPPPYRYTKDYVVVLSDWSNTHPDQILANLKKDGDYYSPRFPLQPSLMKFMHDYDRADPAERQRIIADYKMMQQMRMSIYDISDVAYDAFLLNGQPNSHPWTAPVKVGDVVRLRFIGASASTNFNVKIPGAMMEMVHVEGNNVKPYAINNFFITPGETDDVLVKIQKNSPYIIYAAAADTTGVAYGALLTNPAQNPAYNEVEPFPEPEPVTREMMNNMMAGMDPPVMDMPMNSGMKMSGMKHASMKQVATTTTVHSMHAMQMGQPMAMSMPTEATIKGDTISPPASKMSEMKMKPGVPMMIPRTSGTKYQDLTAAVKTNDPNKPVTGIIKMELFGYMNHFIWMINGTPEYRAKPIIIEPGNRYRIVFINNSMMHHPMHIHGHWFILRNGHGVYDPLLHTIDVPPGATVVADLDADASGQWFFHCHHLYHMMTGMSRVFQYETIIDVVRGTQKPQAFVTQTPYMNRPIIREDEVVPIDPSLVHHPMAHPPGFYLANYLDIGEDPFNNVQKIDFKGLYGPDYNKLELYVNDAEMTQGDITNADLDIFYWHLVSQFWAVKGGANYFYRPAARPYWQPGIGIEGLMPYFIDTDVRIYNHDGSTKLDTELSRDTQITNNFFIRLGVRGIGATQTVPQDDVGSGLNELRYMVTPYYRLKPGVSLFAEYEHEKDYGAFKNILLSQGESGSDNTVTFGFSFVF